MSIKQSVCCPIIKPQSAISASGYTPYVGHEFSPKGDAIAALRRAFEIFNVT